MAADVSLRAIFIRGVLAIAKNDLRVLWRDPTPLILVVVVPLILMFFFKPIAGLVLRNEGFESASGAEQVVPGMSVVFAFFIVGEVGFALFREHGWGTWDRLRASPLRPPAIILGKSIVPICLVLVQSLTLFVVGWLGMGINVLENVVWLVAIAASTSMAFVTIGMMFASFLRSTEQVNAVATLSGIIFGTIGGGFIPLEALPAWSRAVAPLTPTYWPIRAYRDILIEPADPQDAGLAIMVLLVISAGAALVTSRRFSFSERKVYT